MGLGSMIGAGIFAVLGPAARAAGSALLLGLLVAGFVAYANASSSAALAARYPESGGTYVYARQRLNAFWGFLAGWGFVIGKLASCAAMALTFAFYAAPSHAQPVAFTAVAILTAINYYGVSKTALATRAIVVVVLACLAAVALAAAFGGHADVSRAIPNRSASAYGILQAAGFLFFAFAGYARIATLGEEVVDPRAPFRVPSASHSCSRSSSMQRFRCARWSPSERRRWPTQTRRSCWRSTAGGGSGWCQLSVSGRASPRSASCSRCWRG